MVFKLELPDEALSDLDQAIEWYNLQKPDLGNYFYLEIVETFEQLEQHPNHYGFFIEEYRQAILKNFPYRIVFKIFNDNVVVLGIVHTSRSDNEILKRL